MFNYGSVGKPKMIFYDCRLLATKKTSTVDVVVQKLLDMESDV